MSPVEAENSPVQMEFISDPSVNYFLMDSLDPNSYYTFKVIARTSAGDGPPIKQRAATLLEGGALFTVFHFVVALLLFT